MSPFSLSPRAGVRTALLGLAVTVALTACGQAKGVISPAAVGSGDQSSAPSSPTSSSAPRSTASSAAPDVKKSASADEESPKPATKTASGAKTVPSDVSQLKSLGVDLGAGVLIDVADDGLDRYLEIGDGGTIDFTGTSQSDNTMMALNAAQVAKRTEATKNRVVIAPPFYNEDLGAGSCIADTAAGVLRLVTCKAGAANQIWEVVPAGDSGQFELHGVKTDIRVNNGQITTGDEGYVGLQTIKFGG